MSDEKRLSLEQEQALDICTDMSNAIASVTGGAGTGKTLVLGYVYRELKKQRKTVALCAPTGRAAKRIQELTGIPAKTVHRQLQYPMPDDAFDDDHPINKPRRNNQNPFDEQVIIVDESSMISPQLYREVLDALPRGGVVRFFGDNNQLPPVEEGKPPFITVLKDFPSITLSFNYRSEDHIVSNALRILRGAVPNRNDHFEIVWSDNPLKSLLQAAPKDYAESAHQIIMPTRRGSYGTARMNVSLQLKFNGKGESLLLERYAENEAKLLVRKEDKFLWIKNDYNLSIFNGQTGTIGWINTEDGTLGLDADGREFTVPARIKTYRGDIGAVIQYDPRKQIELGYAITTHKAQGSEFESVIYCIARGHAWMLNRRNFYTAITRAKRNVVVIADRRAMYFALQKADV